MVGQRPSLKSIWENPDLIADEKINTGFLGWNSGTCWSPRPDEMGYLRTRAASVVSMDTFSADPTHPTSHSPDRLNIQVPMSAGFNVGHRSDDEQHFVYPPAHTTSPPSVSPPQPLSPVTNWQLANNNSTSTTTDITNQQQHRWSPTADRTDNSSQALVRNNAHVMAHYYRTPPHQITATTTTYRTPIGQLPSSRSLDYYSTNVAATAISCSSGSNSPQSCLSETGSNPPFDQHRRVPDQNETQTTAGEDDGEDKLAGLSTEELEDLRRALFSPSERRPPPADYICDCCKAVGEHYINDCMMRVVQLSSPHARTPYQGSSESFGVFKCEHCGHRWQSSRCFANVPQQCKKCAQHIFPFKMFSHAKAIERGLLKAPTRKHSSFDGTSSAH